MKASLISHTGSLRSPLSLFSVILSILYLLVFPASEAQASISNRLYRVDIRSHKDYTRIIVRLAEPPVYNLTTIPGSRMRLVIQDTGGTLFKKFRRYSDRNIGGLTFLRRGDNLLITFQVAPLAGYRDLSRPDVSAITLDVGAPFKTKISGPAFQGREKIWSGVEKLVRDFDPPLKSEIPFSPTDRQILKNFLDENDQKLFMSAEAALYRGLLSEAEEIFTQFASRQIPVRPLAMYRLAETWYKLQKYPQALSAFREAEKLWPAYLGFNPGVTFYYGDSIARSGDLAQARLLLASLVGRLADKKYAPALLVRLGDILSRQGHDMEALAIYMNVAENFKDNKANGMALMRRADLQFLQATPWNYRPLSAAYLNASRQSGDLDMREESLFKHVLLESIHGDAGEALQLVTSFQKKFPRGVYVAVIRTIREVLVADVYRNTDWRKDPSSLVRFVEEQHDYLSDCIGQPGFLKSITAAFSESGRPIELIKLLDSLVERQWASPIAPDVYLEIVDNSELIGDMVTAERAIKAFLRKFPADPRSREMTERLGEIYFTADKHQQVKDTLLWLLNKGEKARLPESYYRLGRSLWSLQLYPQASRAMDIYLVATPARDARLLPDAYYVAVSSRENIGDRKGALKLLDAALKLADNRRREEFIYKSGDISLRDGNISRARAMFEQLDKNGKDPDWQKLARQALATIDTKSAVR